MRDLVPFAKFKKREKHPWRCVTFSKIETPSWVFFTVFFNCTNGTKSRKASEMYLLISLYSEKIQARLNWYLQLQDSKFQFRSAEWHPS